MNNPIAKWFIVGICGLLISGCITHQSTVYRDVERINIQFENDTAARIFYDALHEKADARSRVESRTEIDIPIIFEHERRVMSGPNAAFNDAVTVCDTNKDGNITELEAKIFAEQIKKR